MATRPWKAAIAAEVAAELGGEPAGAEPIVLLCAFYFVRPLSHLKKSGGLTKSAPRAMVRTPDIDKLLRAVLDALAGVLYVNDSYVVELHASKRYGDRARLELEWSTVPTGPTGVPVTVEPAARP